jgi:tetratricopeptide (TPR) repeat protein
MTRFLFTIAMLAFLGTCTAQGHFKWTSEAKQAYQKLTQLRLREASTQIEQIKKEDPDNLIVYHLENYIDFFTLYILEDKTTFKNRKPNRDIRLEIIKAGDPESPYYLFAQADIRMQWALLKFKFNDYLGGFQDVNKAHNLLVKNTARYPDFLPNQKNLSILHSLVGTIPDQYMWGVKLLSGLEGTIAQGRREMEAILNHAQFDSFIFADEMKAIYAYFLLHLDNEPEAAWQYIQSAEFSPDQNPLHCFVMANIAMRSGHNDEAIELLRFQPHSRAMLPFDHLNFMLGLAKIHRLDPDADIYLKRFTEQFPGDTFKKEAYQKLAWHALLFEGEAGYFKYMEQCSKNGYIQTGSDKNAQKEAASGLSPQVGLVSARLLFDGGYYEEALQILDVIDGEEFPEERDQLEYYYRKGRIYHGLKNHSLAIWHYQQTIHRGEKAPFFYACNAALQTALIYEKLEKKNLAETFFQRCLTMYPDEYQNSLHQRAKAGLNRLRDQ